MATQRQDFRSDAIQRIVNKYIGNLMANETGTLLQEPDFTVLAEEVRQLRALSVGEYWKKGCDQWSRHIVYAATVFRDGNGISHIAPINPDLYPPYEAAGRELLRLFKWAVMQGAIEAMRGNY